MTKRCPFPALVAPTPVPSCREGRKCDCLNDCGDDPWIRDNKADPCEHLKARQAAYDARATAEKAIELLHAQRFDELIAAIQELGVNSERYHGNRP